MGNDIFSDTPPHTVSPQSSQEPVQQQVPIVVPPVAEVPPVVPQQPENVKSPTQAYMEKLQEVFGMSEVDPRREEKLLAFMDQLEAVRAAGEISIVTIGEGKDRVLLFQRPATILVEEPAHIPLNNDEGDGRRVGTMATVKDRYLAVNRKGLVGFDVTHDQRVKVDGSAEMFSDPNSPYKESPTNFNRQFGKWLEDGQINAQRNGLRGARRIVEVMQEQNFPKQPDPKQFASTNDPAFLEAEQIWTMGSFMHPDGQWNGLITSSDVIIDEPDRRTPKTGYWFDNGGGYRPFNARKPETLENILQANMKKPNLPQPMEPPKPPNPPFPPIAAAPQV